MRRPVRRRGTARASRTMRQLLAAVVPRQRLVRFGRSGALTRDGVDASRWVWTRVHDRPTTVTPTEHERDAASHWSAFQRDLNGSGVL